ncbi:MAG: sugar nucleotide-binding protein [Candidatus Omnitrophota bacterium]
MTKNKTWLIVGGDGCIGSHLAVETGRLADHVVTSSRRTALRTGQVFADLATGDTNALVSLAPEVVFLCAAVSSITFCRDNPDLSRQTNVTGTVRLAAELVRRGSFVIFLSSNAVFDGNTEKPDEGSAYCPTTEYGRQKVSAEQQLLTLPGSKSSVAIIRLSKVLSPDSGMAKEFLARLKAGVPCPALNDLCMSPVSMSYVTDNLLAIARAKRAGVFHLSGAEEMTYADFASRLACCLEADKNLVRSISSGEAGCAIAFRPAHPALGMKRTLALLGIEPESTEHLMEKLVTGY